MGQKVSIHMKNMTLRLSPAYDILTTSVYVVERQLPCPVSDNYLVRFSSGN